MLLGLQPTFYTMFSNIYTALPAAEKYQAFIAKNQLYMTKFKGLDIHTSKLVLLQKVRLLLVFPMESKNMSRIYNKICKRSFSSPATEPTSLTKPELGKCAGGHCRRRQPFH